MYGEEWLNGECECKFFLAELEARCSAEVLTREGYALVKHIKFSYADVLKMTSLERHEFINLLQMENELKNQAMEDAKNSR